jgi:L-seryl-tRNA(Ser) seleniumtransferase
MTDQQQMARLPKVDQVLEQPALTALEGEIPRALVVKAVRRHLEDLRGRLLRGQDLGEIELSPGGAAQAAAALARRLAQPSLRRVVNATGVVVHTNLGRSLLAQAALNRLLDLNRAYTNLEYDLAQGRRGSRYDHVIDILKELTGAEAALVVNNNAAAVFLALQTLADKREVIVSRGQLVEIGGSFRIPEVMARSGAVLKEVGATNKTHLRDYEGAIGSQTAMVLKVHTSNYAMLGFTSEVPLAELRGLCDRYHLPLMEDLGSGVLLDLSHWGLPKEPTVPEALQQGADLVTFSGDKLLGGPQAGVILGRADLVARLRENHTNRALRIDKLTLAALEATLELYRDPEQAVAQIPTLRMITSKYQALSRRAASLAGKLRKLGLPRLTVETVDGVSRVGGGALPLAAPKTRLVRVSVAGLSPTRLEEALRANDPPIICRLEDGRLLMDVRTLLPGDTAVIAEVLARLAA